MTNSPSHLRISPQPAPNTLIHLGMPKTATTFLQMYLFAQHSQVSYLGKFEGESLFVTPAIKRLAKCLRQPRPFHNRRQFPELSRKVDELRASGKLLVFSDEGFTYSGRDNKRAQAETMRQVFGDAKILITIREPLSFMETLYLQELRGYHYHPSSYKRLTRKFGMPPRHFDIDPWMDNAWSCNHHGAFDHLMVYDTAEAYADVFGEQNVLVKVYEEMKGANIPFVRQLSAEIGIDADESERLTASQGASKNIRWLQGTVDRLKTFNSSPLKRWNYRWFKSTRQLKEYLGVSGPNQIVGSPVARAPISPRWRERIVEIARDQYGRIAGRWNLPLEAFGYPIAPSATETTYRESA